MLQHILRLVPLLLASLPALSQTAPPPACTPEINRGMEDGVSNHPVIYKPYVMVCGKVVEETVSLPGNGKSVKPYHATVLSVALPISHRQVLVTVFTTDEALGSPEGKKDEIVFAYGAVLPSSGKTFASVFMSCPRRPIPDAAWIFIGGQMYRASCPTKPREVPVPEPAPHEAILTGGHSWQENTL